MVNTSGRSSSASALGSLSFGLGVDLPGLAALAQLSVNLLIAGPHDEVGHGGAGGQREDVSRLQLLVSGLPKRWLRRSR